MKPNQGREAAYVTSRVKDLSLITNTPDYVGLFACITPKAHSSLEEPENNTLVDGVKTYLPQLIRDVETLDTLFGDPRVDPQTYKDLNAVRYIVQNGFACYVAKVKSGEPFSVMVQSQGLFSSAGCPSNPQLEEPELTSLNNKLRTLDLFQADSSVVGTNELAVRLVPIKPYSINQVALEIEFTSQATSESDRVVIASTRVLLNPETKNVDLIKTINAYLGGDIVFQLPEILDDAIYATPQEATEYKEPDENNNTYFCISNVLLYICGLYDLIDTNAPVLVIENMELHTSGDMSGLSTLTDWTTAYNNPTNSSTFTCSIDPIQESVLDVKQESYVRSLGLYKDPKYAGCFISELCAEVTREETKLKTVYEPKFYSVVSPEDVVEGETYYIQDEEGYKVRTAENQDRTVYEREGVEAPYTYVPLSGDEDPEQTYYVQVDDSKPISDENSQVKTDETILRTIYSPSMFISIPVSSMVEGNTYYIKDNGEFIVRTEANATYTVNALVEMWSNDRRGLHFIVKQVAAQRKDLTCVFNTPYSPHEDKSGNPVSGAGVTLFDLDRACNWVAAKGDYYNLVEYGTAQALDYSEQSFYCEIYWSWLKWRVPKLVNGLATASTAIIVPPSAFVILNSLISYRSRGCWYPVAGDQGGILPDSCIILQNPATKGQRDKLISYRINPIYDTGLRGVQIYGNDTLNPQYTDLSSSHIARTLVQIRSRVDAYTETVKFSLNDQFTWGSWINYVSTKILDPIRSLEGLQWFQVDMGYNTTTREEISQRKIRGMISLQFYQSLEIIDLEFVVYSSAMDMEAGS